MKKILLIYLLLIILLTGCKERRNEYYFSGPPNDWFLIVNGCSGSKMIDNNEVRKFHFPDNGIILLNDASFNITSEDLFFFNGKQFNPNSDSKNSYKLCYYMSSLRSGYTNKQKMQTYDVYFFKVDQDCDKGRSMEQVFDDLNKYLIQHNIDCDSNNME